MQDFYRIVQYIRFILKTVIWKIASRTIKQNRQYE